MPPDSPFGQVISLSSKRLVTDAPAPNGGDAVLRDVLAGGPFDAAVTGFVLACLPDTVAPVLWVSDRMSRRENGRLYGAALRRFGFKGRVLRVEVSHPRDVLWAMEEGVACAGLAHRVHQRRGLHVCLSLSSDLLPTPRVPTHSPTDPIWRILYTNNLFDFQCLMSDFCFGKTSGR